MFCPGEVPAATRLLLGECGKITLHLLYDRLQDLVVCLARCIGTLPPKFRFFSRLNYFMLQTGSRHVARCSNMFPCTTQISVEAGDVSISAASEEVPVKNPFSGRAWRIAIWAG